MAPLSVAVILWICCLTGFADETARALPKQEKMSYSSALDNLAKAVATIPKSAEAYLARGVLKTRGSHPLAQAMADFDRAIEMDPTLADAYFQRAVIHFVHGHNDAVIADCTCAIELQPTFAAAWNARGKAQVEKKDYAAALADFQQALQLDPAMDSAWYYSGFIHQVQGEWEAALADFNQAVKVNPRDVSSLEASRRIKLRQGDLDGALADSERLLSPKSGSSSPFLWFDHGLVQMMRGDYSSAMADFKKVPVTSLGEYQATFTPIFLWIARAKMGQMPQATEELLAYRGRVRQKTDEKPARSGTTSLLSSKGTPWMGSGQQSNELEAFLLGATREEDFIAHATQGNYPKEQEPARLRQAWYFIGIRRPLAGDQAGATAFFEKCVALEKVGSDEWILARMELQKLPTPKRR